MVCHSLMLDTLNELCDSDVCHEKFDDYMKDKTNEHFDINDRVVARWVGYDSLTNFLDDLPVVSYCQGIVCRPHSEKDMFVVMTDDGKQAWHLSNEIYRIR